jgi:tRNA threonylcarbamoyladenosine biosynthesis protein TsaB
MNLLALDTAVSVLSVALAAGDHTWHFEADAGARHSELLMDIIDMLLKKAGLEPKDLSGVLCMGGPGSFTGLRIGFSAAKGLALALDIPFASVPTLDCMAHGFSHWPGIVIPVIDAKKNRFYCAMYRGGRRLGPCLDAPAAEILGAVSGAESPVLLTGPDADLAQGVLEEIPDEKSPKSPVFIIDPGFRRGNSLQLLSIAKNDDIFNTKEGMLFSGPDYYRASDAELTVNSKK